MPPVRDMTPEDRFRTVARILARGVVRFIEIERRSAIHGAESSKTLTDSSAGPLGPYTKPDPVENTHRMIHIADELLSLDVVPVVPHLTMFWHLLRPHPYQHWLAYDLQLMSRCDIVLRVPGDSNGADREVEHAHRWGLPIIEPATTEACALELREWLEAETIS